MTREQLERVFDPFTQAEPAVGGRYGGVGLGLAIVRRFTELLGGMGVCPSLKYPLPLGVTLLLRAAYAADHRGIGHRIHGHRLLQEAVEQLAAVA
jgi:nitrogen-specific signal transduction histidine kinase